MAHDLSLAQSHAFHLCNDLMVPITLFKSGDEFGVLPSDGHRKVNGTWSLVGDEEV